MRQRGTENGEGKIGCIFWGLLGLIVLLIAVKVVPIKIATMKLEDHMLDLAMSQARHRDRSFFEREIYNKSRTLKLDIPRKQIVVKKYPERVVMDVEFVVPVDVLSYTYDWNIHLHLDRDVFWF